MDNNINTRTSKVLINDKWEDINPIDIKKGMVFKMFESDGTEVISNNKIAFIAESDAFYLENGIICIDTFE